MAAAPPYPEPVIIEDSRGIYVRLSHTSKGDIRIHQVGPSGDGQTVILTQDDLVAALNLREAWLKAHAENIRIAGRRDIGPP